MLTSVYKIVTWDSFCYTWLAHGKSITALFSSQDSPFERNRWL